MAGIIAHKLHPFVLIGELGLISLLSQVPDFFSSPSSAQVTQLASSNKQEVALVIAHEVSLRNVFFL